MTAPVVDRLDFDKFNRDIENMLKEEADRRRLPPEVELYDGDWNSVGIVGRVDRADFQFIQNETGTASLEMPLHYYLSEWVINVDGRATSDVHVRMEKDGARWTGKLDELRIIKDDSGRRFVRLLFKHDFEQLKKMVVYPNPFLPPEIQFPRLWLCFGKAKWALKTTLLCTIMRLESSLWTLPDNPLDKSQWNNFNQSTWWNVVKPTMQGDVDNSLPAIVHSRMKTMFDTSKKIAADSQLLWVCRRYLPGDPLPWEGANLRYGCLVWDLVDKSGFNTGTAFRGNLFAGIIKEFLNIHGDGITETVEQVDDPNVPGVYPTPEVRGTTPANPGVVFWESEMSGIQSSEFFQKPAGAVGSVAGGHSMPGVNELISATVQMIGDLTAMIPFVPPLGGIADALLKPLYTDVFLAFGKIKSSSRARRSGGAHYHEEFAEGADKAYTLGYLLAQRAQMWKTREVRSCTLKVADSAPWTVGDFGGGDFFLGDRVGFNIIGMPTGVVYVEQVSELNISWDRDTAPVWDITIGQRVAKDPVIEAYEAIQEIFSLVQELGVA
ncbi:phage tail protein [Rhodococcus sp. NPDC057297]|uniref:Gp37-like protein n=1 Tax=Rhodococcus sp. NPDC057297 TaxID=3346090 RepID=UPI00362955CD